MGSKSNEIYRTIDKYIAALDGRPPKRIGVTKSAYNTLLSFYNSGKRERKKIKKVPPYRGLEIYIIGEKNDAKN